jgi:hypothetical protein
LARKQAAPRSTRRDKAKHGLPSGRPRVVNEPVNHQGQQIYFGIAATVGHDADLACNFERNPPPAFARPRDTPASLKYVGTFSRACLAA